MSEIAGAIRQLGTHRRLVSATEQRKRYPKLALDAIVVPASRPAWNLEQAISLARSAHSALVIICSHEAVPAQVHKMLTGRSFTDAIVIDLPNSYHHELLEFPALASIENDLPAACSYYWSNLSTKRNLAFLLARMAGWQRIFFLDDDIRDIGYPDLQSTVSMLASYRTAGMRVTKFPDNSAACHAHRMTGGAQDVFLSGAALAVDIEPVDTEHGVGFFPSIYNEDWLFFYDDTARMQLGSSERRATQVVYDPFADPKRAAWQEFGDTLAEGLYALLDRGLKHSHATHDYWIDFLYARQTFLKAIVSRSNMATPEQRESLLSSVEAALECSMLVEPRVLERYIQLWQRDLRRWKRQIAKIRPESSLDNALKRLGLESSAPGSADEADRSLPEADSEGPPTMPYELRDLYDLLGPAADADVHIARYRGKFGGGNRRARILLHHGPRDSGTAD
jgi:hypothetical protein